MPEAARRPDPHVGDPASLRLLLGGRLVDRLPAAVYAACPGDRGEWLYASPRITEILGYAPEEFMTDPDLWARLLHPEDRAMVLRVEENCVAADLEPIEYRMIRRDGQTIWVLDDSVLGEYGDHSLVHHGLLYDITERKRNELLLAAHADIVSQIVAGNDLASILVNLARVTESVSGAARCLIEVHDSPARRAAGVGSGGKLMVSSRGARTTADDASPIPGAHEADFALPDGASAGRVMLHYRPGAVVQLRDRELAEWSARMATVIAVRACERAQSAESLALLAATLESTADGILVLDRSDRVVGHNRKFLEMCDVEVGEDGVVDPALLLSAAARLLKESDLISALPPGQEPQSSLDEVELPDGRILERYQHIERGASAEHNIGRVWSFRDITAHRKLKQELQAQAFNDSLTPLPNRPRFVARLTEVLAETPRPDATVAVLLLDLDDFKTVNDGLGYAAGDKLLIAVADRLRGCLRLRDTAARLGGDEFVVLLEELAEPREAVYAAERILAAVSRPLTIDGQVLTIRASVGIAVREGHEDAADMLRNADLAMYTAKREGGSSCRRFVPDMHADAVARMELKTDLERAINSEQLSVHYQPVVGLETGRILGVEALVRWNHPVRGPIPPIDFIPLAEQTGLIERLGRWVLRQACTDTALWRRTIAGQEDLTVSVNLSPRQLSNGQFPDEVRRVLWASGLPATALILEITETTLAEPGVDAVKVLNDLKHIGLSLALDDFGTGYSSLAQLVKYPLDVVKVDKSFVDQIDGDPANSALTQAVLNIAKALSLSVTVEGIETVEQLDLLVAMGARRGQGYLMARPMPDEEVRALLETAAVQTIPVS